MKVLLIIILILCFLFVLVLIPGISKIYNEGYKGEAVLMYCWLLLFSLFIITLTIKGLVTI